MSKITVYTTDPCSFCAASRVCSRRAACEFAEVNLTKDPAGRVELARRTGMMSFPQVLVGDQLLGGFAEVQQAADERRLDELLRRLSALSAPRRVRQARCAVARDRLRARGAAGSSRTRRCRARRRPSSRSSLPQRTHGSPSRRCTRNWSWKEPARRRRGGSRRSSPRARRCPRCSASIDRVAQPRVLRARQAARPGAAGGCRARNSASSA